MDHLYKKYDVKAPRYTSYPPMPFWNHKMNSELWTQCLERGLRADGKVDLYIHIPFCEKLCWYCGCNRVITKDQERARVYVEHLIAEFRLYLAKLPNLAIRSLHFGGGTPNFLEPELLDKLLQNISPYFLKDEFEGAIEADPRTCFPEHLKVLAKHGFKRISFGIQDFDSNVQQAINRIQPYAMVEKILEHARLEGFDHVNFDLIWGLPKQSVATVKKSIELVSALKPDQISYYSYAHLPEKFSHQKLIKDEDILQGKQKRELYDQGKILLEEAGYMEIGMDHYAREDSILYRAAKERRLKRNFMGYTDAKAANLLGLGSSSISSNPFGFVQNEKSVEAYEQMIKEGKLPISGGHLNGSEDEIRDGIIQELMCNMKLSEASLQQLRDREEITNKLEEFAEDGLLAKSSDGWQVSDIGKTFIRSIAVVFDEYLPQAGKTKTFSQTV